jgi:hypothetical protein
LGVAPLVSRHKLPQAPHAEHGIRLADHPARSAQIQVSNTGVTASPVPVRGAAARPASASPSSLQRGGHGHGTLLSPLHTPPAHAAHHADATRGGVPLLSRRADGAAVSGCRPWPRTRRANDVQRCVPPLCSFFTLATWWAPRVRRVGRREVCEKNITFFFRFLWSFHLLSSRNLTGGSDVRSKASPSWVRKVFNYFRFL